MKNMSHQTLSTAALLSVAALTAQAGPAYRAGLSGGFNTNGGTWNFQTDSADNSVNELGVFAGPMSAKNQGNHYLWGKTDFWFWDGGVYTCWGGYRLWRFEGQMYFDGSTYYFGEDINRGMAFFLDGDMVWMDNTDNTFTTRAVTPSAGWHDIGIRLVSSDAAPPGAHVDGAEGFLLGFGYVKSATKPTSMSALYYPEDSGNGAFLRNVAPGDFITVTSISSDENGYVFGVQAGSAMPGNATVTAYLGDASAVAEKGQEATWAASGSSVTLSPGQSATVSAPWSASALPYFAVKAEGTVKSMDTGNQANGTVMDFWQWTDATKLAMNPSVSASLGTKTGTGAAIGLTLGFSSVIEGATEPLIDVTVYYGAADAGSDTNAWDSSRSYGGMTAGAQSVVLDGLEAGGAYYARVMVQTPDSDPVWSEPLYINLAGVSLTDVPESVYENYGVSQSFTVRRPANASANAITVGLAYSGDTDLVSALPASVTLAAGVDSATVTFAPVDNATADGDGSFTVSLVESSDYALGSPDSATVTVLDDETRGADMTWTGAAGDGQWTTPGNWSLNRVPTVMDRVTIPYTAVSISVASESFAREIYYPHGDELTFTGNGPLNIGGFDRGTAGWPWGDLTLSVPVGVFGGTNVWNGAGDTIVVNNQIARLTDGVVIRKSGSGELTMKCANLNYNGAWHILEGTVNASVKKSFAGSSVVIGGGPAAAKLSYDASDEINTLNSVEVLENGTFYAGHVAKVASLTVREGGRVQTSYVSLGNMFLYGGTIERAASWAGETRFNESLNDVAMKSFANARTARFNVRFTLNNWRNFSMSAEDGEAPVDLVIGNLYETSLKAADYLKDVTRSGAGVIKATEEFDLNRELVLQDGTWLADSASGASGRLTSLTGANSVLGGVGSVVGKYISGQTAVQVSKGTIAPGSIDETTGAPVYGTLTIGSASCANGVVFANNTTLRVSIGLNREYTCLDVYGPVTVGSGTTLEVTAADAEKAKSGEYVVAHAADGFSARFANIVLPESPRTWQVRYEDNCIIVRVPPPESILILM